MKTCFRVILLFLSACLLPISGMAQGLGRDITGLLDRLQAKFWLVAGKVKTVQGDPVRGAA